MILETLPPSVSTRLKVFVAILHPCMDVCRTIPIVSSGCLLAAGPLSEDLLLGLCGGIITFHRLGSFAAAMWAWLKAPVKTPGDGTHYADSLHNDTKLDKNKKKVPFTI